MLLAICVLNTMTMLCNEGEERCRDATQLHTLARCGRCADGGDHANDLSWKQTFAKFEDPIFENDCYIVNPCMAP